ncbi:DNA adenine methylase [Clostridium algifaecis]|uniref:Site-specific DNA-methyltransferase (adenine-specific) n=1 Tax=Clostridium algifaecis TaxID=1472040 RepID=A0ABS4KQT8_9CLOT|nr:DNA adenine methylase [Clostridium algifaecis]MBP2031955.1 DNA adenine methylase [Clostridium algifaecis]
MKNNLIQPFVKWVGGKRQLLSEIKEYIPKGNFKYYEPFVGGGAVFFSLQRKNAVINDLNSELINVYEVIKNDVEGLIRSLMNHKITEKYYYELRSEDRSEEYKTYSKVKKASRFIYLNKTCYNGLYRVNSSGYFNTPFGKYKNPNVVNDTVLRTVHKYLNESRIAIRNVDFEEALKGIRKNSFVYFDPPYDPVSDSSNFTGYTASGFNRDEQIRLKKLCDKLNKKGVKFLLSNSNTEFIRELYKDYNDKIKVVGATRAINSKATKRGEVEEVLIRNYDLE